MTNELTSKQVQMATKIVMEKGDSVASSHYWREKNTEVFLKSKT